MITPNDIDVLIHYHSSPAPHPRVTAPAVREAIEMFVVNDILTPKGMGYKTTTRGRLWLKMILDTPFPIVKETVQIWVDPRTGRFISL